MISRTLTIATVAAVLLTAAPIAAQSTTGTVAGTVVGPEGNPVPGASLVIVDTRLEATTDRLGRFRIPLVPSGDQQLNVRFIGLASSRSNSSR